MEKNLRFHILMTTTPIYFIITYQRNKIENASDIDFVIPENKELKPECILSDETYDNKKYYYKKVFKASTAVGKGKKGNNYYFEFEIGDNKYIISFDSKGSSFVYDVSLETGKRRIQIIRKVDQNSIDYNEKMDFFEKALKQKGEENKIDNLYKETIDLYSKKKGFYLLIALFLKVYKKKDLCSSLLKKFREMNGNPKDNEKNMDRKSYLKDYSSIFKQIRSEADQLISSNEYNTVDYYGIIFCYLNYYDYDNFTEIIKELSNQKPNDLYEILLIYNAHFKYPINGDYNFFNKFIKYCILNKEFPIFQRGLNYVKDLEIYLTILEENKDNFYDKYLNSDDSKKNEQHIIKQDHNLKLKKNSDLKEINKENKGEDNVISTQIEEANSNNKKSVQQIKEENDAKIRKKKRYFISSY